MHGDLVHEDFLGRSVSEAFARCSIDSVGDRLDCRLIQCRNVRVGGQGPAQTTVEVLDTALLPRRSGLAEVAVHPEFAMEYWIGGELGSPIERDRAA